MSDDEEEDNEGEVEKGKINITVPDYKLMRAVSVELLLMRKKIMGALKVDKICNYNHEYIYAR